MRKLIQIHLVLLTIQSCTVLFYNYRSKFVANYVIYDKGVKSDIGKRIIDLAN